MVTIINRSIFHLYSTEPQIVNISGVTGRSEAYMEREKADMGGQGRNYCIFKEGSVEM